MINEQSSLSNVVATNGTTAYSSAIKLSTFNGVAFIVTYSGTSISGSITIEVSNDGVNFYTYPGTAYTASFTSATSGSFVAEIVNTHFFYARIKVISTTNDVTAAIQYGCKSFNS